MPCAGGFRLPLVFPPGFQTGPRGMEWNGGGRGEGGGGENRKREEGSLSC